MWYQRHESAAIVHLVQRLAHKRVALYLAHQVAVLDGRQPGRLPAYGCVKVTLESVQGEAEVAGGNLCGCLV